MLTRRRGQPREANCVRRQVRVEQALHGDDVRADTLVPAVVAVAGQVGAVEPDAVGGVVALYFDRQLAELEALGLVAVSARLVDQAMGEASHWRPLLLAAAEGPDGPERLLERRVARLIGAVFV